MSQERRFAAKFEGVIRAIDNIKVDEDDYKFIVDNEIRNIIMRDVAILHVISDNLSRNLNMLVYRSKEHD